MKISLCKHSKDVEKTAKFLERNLRKVDIEIKGCIDQCDECRKKTVANIDGKEISAKDGYGLLKEVHKILKKKDKLDLIQESALKGIKKELKEDKARDKDDKKDKDKDKDKAKDKESKKDKDDKKDKDEKKNRQKNSDEEINRSTESGKGSVAAKAGLESLPEETIEARIIGDQVILTVPHEQFSLENMRISLNMGSFGGENSTYEVRKLEKSVTDKLMDHESVKNAEKAQVLAFSTPDLLGTPHKEDDSDQ